jgi:hypothetical protein
MGGWELLRLTGGQAATLAAGGAGLALIYFLLRPRARLVEVASHVLWEQVLPKRRDPRLWELMLLAVQVLAIVGISLALGEPVRREAPSPALSRQAGEGEAAPLDRLWVVDLSLSMGALAGEGEAGETRIGKIRALLDAEAAALPEGVRVSLVGAGTNPELLSPLGAPVQRLRLAARLLESGPASADLAAALDLAAAQPGLRAGRTLAEIWTDEPDAAAQAAAFSERSAIPVRVRAPFRPAPNLALLAFDVRATEGIPAEEEALVRVANLATEPAEARLRLETADAVLGEANLQLAPGEEVTRRYRFVPGEAGGVEALLRDARFVESGAGDALPADDRAFAWLQPLRPVRAVLVTRGNRYLERALALLPGIELRRVAPEAWPGSPEAASAVADDRAAPDVVFFDGVSPEGEGPPRAVHIAPDGRAGPFRVLRRSIAPAVTDWNADHPLLRGLILRDLQVQDSAVLEERPGDVRLLGSPSGALALARETGDGRRLVAWGFDFARSDLPLRLAFPQLVVQTLLWMRQGRALGEAPGTRHPLSVPLALDAARADAGGLATLTDLAAERSAERSGDARAMAAARLAVPIGSGGETPLRLARPGHYRLDGGEGPDLLAVSTDRADESRTADLPSHDARPVPAPAPAPRVDAGPRPPWMLLTLLAAALLLLEFAGYTR